MLDVIIFLFENFLKEAPETLHSEPSEYFMELLKQEDFEKEEVLRALLWLKDFGNMLEPEKTMPLFLQQPSETHFRVFSPVEIMRLGETGTGYLCFLEKKGLITPLGREIILERLLALEYKHINKDMIKWVTFIVQFFHFKDFNLLEYLEHTIVHEAEECHPH